MTPTYRSSRPAECVEPRAHRDPSQRYFAYGKVQSMDDEPSHRPLRRLAVIAFAFAVLLYFTDRVASGIIVTFLEKVS